MLVAISTLVAYDTKLKAFMADITGEDMQFSSPSAAAPAVKGD